jgi:hypothetical protein
LKIFAIQELILKLNRSSAKAIEERKENGNTEEVDRRKRR